MQGGELPLLAGSVWIHQNRPGTKDLVEGRAIELQMPEGLIVYPENAPNPARLPILGLRALVRNRLTIVINGKQAS